MNAGRVINLLLLRCVMRLPASMVDRLDQIAADVSAALLCEVSRAAVVRAAVEVWLDVIEGVSREQLIEAIRSSLVKRGRKAATPRDPAAVSIALGDHEPM